MNLSKSRYTRGAQCPKMLWMEAHRPELFDASVLNEKVLATGNEVGDLAMGYYGDFVEIPFDAHDFAGMAQLTRYHVEQGTPVVCEATFAHDGNLCMVDVLLVEPDGVRLVEVKSSTHVREVYLHDMAYQCWLLGECGLRVKSAALMHVDGSYVREGSIDVRKLFKVVDCTDTVFSLVASVGERVRFLKEVADRSDEPGALGAMLREGESDAPADAQGSPCARPRSEFGIGPHCANPYPCGYRAWCWRAVPENSVFDLARMNMKKAFDLYDQGIVTFDDANAAGLRPGGLARLQLELSRTGESAHIDAHAVREAIAPLTTPLYFLDFETFQPAVPLYDGTHPYEQVPTQYSLHIVRDFSADLSHAERVVCDPARAQSAGDAHDLAHEGESCGARALAAGATPGAAAGAGAAPFEHREFLAQPSGDPRRAVAEALVRDIPRDVCVVAYNMSFERMVLKNLADAYPDLADHLLAVCANMCDLMVPFRNGAYYCAAQKGSYSIKAVLPALFPNDSELDYHALDGVRNGAEASAAFADLAGMTPEQAALVRASLLRYCELDTLAMVRIWQKLREV